MQASARARGGSFADARCSTHTCAGAWTRTCTRVCTYASIAMHMRIRTYAPPMHHLCNTYAPPTHHLRTCIHRSVAASAEAHATTCARTLMLMLMSMLLSMSMPIPTHMHTHMHMQMQMQMCTCRSTCMREMALGAQGHSHADTISDDAQTLRACTCMPAPACLQPCILVLLF
jgi:hypothetical protein